MKYKLEDFHRNVSDEELIADLKRVASLSCNEFVTSRQYNAQGEFHSNTLMARFGSWAAACRKAGLDISVNRDISDEDFFRNLEEV